jgi:DNA repair protein RadC
MHIASHPHYNAECECLAGLLLNTRRKFKGHQLVSIETMDTILAHPREIFRVAIITAASALVVMHNHPSGESSPLETDIKVTRDLIRAGQLLRLEVIDHVMILSTALEKTTNWSRMLSCCCMGITIVIKCKNMAGAHFFELRSKL